MWKQSECCHFIDSQSGRKRRQRHHPRYLSPFVVFAIACVVLAANAPLCHGFFFPKSFFRKATENPPPPPPPPPQQRPRVLPANANGQFYGTETLQGSGTDIQPALRIVNRPPPPPRNNDQIQEPSGPVPGANFHVPKELCMACERFPWMPMAGAERHVASSASSSVPQSQTQQKEQPRQQYQSPVIIPTKTIVINALGEAQGPVPLPPAIPSRRPFAIQFDGKHSGNNAINSNYKEPSSPPQINAPVVQQNAPAPKPEKPMPFEFQIFQTQSPPQFQNTIQQQPHPIGLNPPPLPPSNPQPAYGRPTLLQPAIATHGPPVGASVNGNQPAIPPNPLTVGTIIASQQTRGNGPLAEFQKIQPAKLVYQEHFISQKGSNAPPAPQNFKVPILPHPIPQDNKSPSLDGGYSSNNIPVPQIPQQQNYGPPPPPLPQDGGYRPLLLQMRPPAPFQMHLPRPSTNMKPPGPMIHYGKPIRIPTNIGPQRPSGQVLFPPPQAFLQMSPPPPHPPKSLSPNIGYGAPEQNAADSGLRPQDERRPSPSGQVLNIQPAVQQQINNQQTLNTNSIHPVPIPVPTPIQSSNSQKQANGNNNHGNRPPAPPTFTQETGWEIIPSIQTDLTHLFNSEKGHHNSQARLPVPVPIPVPQSHSPNNPMFIVAGANQHETEAPIKVQDVTYHEESRNPIQSGSSQLNTLSKGAPPKTNEPNPNSIVEAGESKPQNYNNADQTKPLPPRPSPQIQPHLIRPRPFILGVPTGPARPVIYRPRPQQPYEPLHPSIMTALNHAQQTSLLTHQYLTQSNGVQPFRDNTIYVSPAVPANLVNSQLQQQLQHLKNNVALGGGVSAQEAQVTKESIQTAHGIDPRIPSNSDQTSINCKNQQHFIPIQTHQKLQQQQQQQQQLIESDDSDKGIAPQEITGEFTSGDAISSSSLSYPENNRYNAEDSSSVDGNLKEHEGNVEYSKPTTATFESSPSTSSASTSQGIRGSLTLEDNGNKGSYLIYYPRQVTKSPVYWVQPSRTASQGVVRLAPQLASVSPSVASTVVSWSRPRVVVANQFRANPPRFPSQFQEGRAEETHEKEEALSSTASREQTASEQFSSQVEDADDEEIPYGQRLGVTRHNNKLSTPFDIISVSGSDDDAQSLEETESTGHGLQDSVDTDGGEKDQISDSEFSSSGRDEQAENINEGNQGTSTSEFIGEQQEQLQNEHHLQNVQETRESHQDNADDSDDEQDEDFGLRPQTIFRKPISTTVIHSPGSSSFQSLKLPNFKPNRVIVHDFTSHSANAASTGPSAEASESQGIFESSEKVRSTSIPSNVWKVSQKIKAPKLVDNEGDEESSESVHKPQGFNIQEVIASGAVSTADCLTTAHTTGHLHTSTVSTTMSPRSVESVAKARDILLPLGSRFPGGRPSIFSAAVRRPIPSQRLSVPSTSSVSPTTASTTTERSRGTIFSPPSSTGNNNKKEIYFGQNPGGFAASIPVPVYRRPTVINHHSSVESLGREEHTLSSIHGSDSAMYIRPQANIILTAEDIYKSSEMKEESGGMEVDPSVKPVEVTTTVASSPTSSVESETIDTTDEIMSTERSSSFSVSVVDDRGSFRGSTNNEDGRVGLVKSNNLQQVDVKPLKVNVVQVTSVPVVDEADKATSTTAASTSTADSVTSTTSLPLPASTSTKIVKTVRVRQRMRSGSFNGPLRTRFHGPGRVRVVHRPANQEYIRHFPEFATQEGNKLAKEEEQEVKNALIELKKSTETAKTH